MRCKKKLLPLTCSLVLAGSLASLPAMAGESGQSAANKATGEDSNEYLEEDVREAWMEGKLETAFLLNRHLNNFTIDSEVDGHTVVLSGTVSSDVDRDLAEQIAMNVDGIEEVRNKLEVNRDQATDQDSGERKFGTLVEDATLTAEVKMKLLANSNTEGLDINVDTQRSVVTLHGQVASDEKKALAGEIAANVSGVAEVVNRLEVRS
ncbi:BON domain-containing protein [Parahaliea mediterranea]|uniref:BON domain-containing protein n=1 Tax=Parahaliea mediterranea TaxID=651086 RepID=A0A939DHI1_9GAMM|nr:BON domain-containing protein [Parahaliea mediterranea]MBN7798349.1 BON domain-containing protein [Parahaliea mediterranea]